MIIWIASYPKSGNTWVRSFLSKYLSNKKGFDFKLLDKIDKFPNQKLARDLNIDTSNFMNIASNWEVMQDYINLTNSTTYLKTHNALATVSGHKFTNSINTIGYIYLVRDPRDVVLSFASHTGLNVKETLENMRSEKYFEDLAVNIKHRSTLISSWANNYNSWKNCNFVEGVVIKFEDLISNPIKTFTKIIRYLNKIDKVKIDETKIIECSENTNFDNLKKLEEEGGFKEKITSNKFFRKGVSGDWKNNLDEKTVVEIEKIFNKEMKELGYI